jgi:hypothetical protein
MFRRYFDTTEIDAFAVWIVAELGKAVEPDQCNVRSKKVDQRVQKLNERVARRTAEFIRGGRLNIYTKAKLGTRVQDGLESAGYPADFSKRVSYDLVALVATADTRTR